MKKFLFLSFLILNGIVLCQDKKHNPSIFDINFFSGNAAVHQPDVLHLVTGHPNGFIASWSKKTFGKEDWQQRYNYPDYGLSFSYQDFQSPVLGENFGIYAHYSFYFFKRRLMLRLGQGMAYTTNSYDKVDNPKNIAYGSDLMGSTFIMLNYKKENLFKRLGIQAGISLLHYSNANVKAPNTGINTIVANVGINYNLGDQDNQEYISDLGEEKFSEPFRYNFQFASGVNQSDVVGSAQFPFYNFTFYVDKRINQKSAFQLGTEVFISNFLKEFIKFRSIAYPEDNSSGDEDFKRVSLLAGHELFINKISIISQAGYYIYFPYEFEGRLYFRVGLKHYFGKSRKIFASAAVKAHAFKAESAEFGIGVRL